MRCALAPWKQRRAIDLATALHDELDLARVVEVRERVFGEDDEIGRLPGLDGAQLAFPVERDRRVSRRDPEHLGARDPCLFEEQQLVMEARARNDPGIRRTGSGGENHAALVERAYPGEEIGPRRVRARVLALRPRAGGRSRA